jgi:polar amino acid transport system substrate-binding protein
MKSKHILLITLILGAFTLPSAYGAEANHLTINCTFHSPYEMFFFSLVEEICARNHISVKRNSPPVGRSLIHVNEGIDDGDGPRIGGLSKAFPNLVRVSEPFGEFHFGAFATARHVKIDAWSDLSELNVAHIHGWKIFDERVTVAKSITKVKNRTLLFKLLDAERADVALITKLSGYATIQELNLKRIRFIEPPLAVAPNYLYLHKRHQALAVLLSQTLKALKQDGTYHRIFTEIIPPDFSK